MGEAESIMSAAERLLELPRCLERLDGFSAVVAALQAGDPATIEGAWGSSRALAAAALAAQAPGLLLVVCPQQADVDQFRDDLDVFTAARHERFPAWESEPGERIVHDEIYGDRLSALKQLLGTRPPQLLVTSIEALIQPVPARDVIANSTRRLAVGDRCDDQALARWLAEHKYHATTAVELPGEFSHRGGILDVFAADWASPVRIELFGDEIDSLRSFDVATQRSLETLGEIELTVLTPGGKEGGALADYLPEQTWCLLVEPQQAEENGRKYLERAENHDRLHGMGTVMKSLLGRPHASLYDLAPGTLGATCRLQVASVERFSGDIAKVREELAGVADDSDVFILCETDAEVHRLHEIFDNTPLATAGRLHYPLGHLQSGFRLLPERLLIVSGGELFQRTDLRRPAQRRLGKAIDSFLDLREGDLIVYLPEGIGRYRGLKMLEKGEHVEEHLELEFHGGTRVYVPATKMQLVQKYVGGRKARPRLATIGGKTWSKQKKAAQEATNDLALEMLELQAQRRARPGIQLGPDSVWQREFDAAFPYRETDDQLAAIEDIKHDQTQPRPMDRLLCGDVGFGKTEMAIRAAFKAADNGYQVAVLVPTTILAEQHFHTFRERMAEFPFTIGRLSRFVSDAEQRETVEGLQSGAIDIVIGTHRLASRDVTFNNLGLVIIDEEQRFGVEVKERLKTLRSTVDVLTMTATPIPRTLHMSMVGLRDISNLQTPPADRIKVETRVARFSHELIRTAVLRELNRGGQVYFVHNRVNDIQKLASKLRQIVPEASLRIGHGQMHETELEEVMVDFVAGKFDLLLATTIVESGLDIPNANTIFIDEADRYGLADLHQLRGRVGRYKHRAYCYMLIEPHKSITPNAARRLHAIEEFSSMGAGFAIAMRDLEIRGAGNILGTQQSGHIAAVGYELYCELLETSVRKLKRMPPKLSLDVEISLPVSAFLPAEYVPEMRQKIDLYRRIARVTSEAELNDLRGEMVDRFGKLPAPAERLLELTSLKIDAAIWQVQVVRLEENFLVLKYGNRSRIEQLSRLLKNRLRVVDDEHAYLPLRQGVVQPEAILKLAKSVLRQS